MVKFFVYMSCFFLLVKSGTIEITVKKDTESNNEDESSDGNSSISVKITEIKYDYSINGWFKTKTYNKSWKPSSLTLQIGNKDATDDKFNHKCCPSFKNNGESVQPTGSECGKIKELEDDQTITISCTYGDCQNINLINVIDEYKFEVENNNNKKEVI